jgi:hypothetical protein
VLLSRFVAVCCALGVSISNSNSTSSSGLKGGFWKQRKLLDAFHALGWRLFQHLDENLSGTQRFIYIYCLAGESSPSASGDEAGIGVLGILLQDNGLISLARCFSLVQPWSKSHAPSLVVLPSDRPFISNQRETQSPPVRREDN